MDQLNPDIRRPRRYASIGAVALLWWAWLVVAGWMHQKDCIDDLLWSDQGLGASGAATCQGPTLMNPVGGIGWTWPPDGALWSVIIGTAVMLALLVVILRRGIQPSAAPDTQDSTGVDPDGATLIDPLL